LVDHRRSSSLRAVIAQASRCTTSRMEAVSVPFCLLANPFPFAAFAARTCMGGFRFRSNLPEGSTHQIDEFVNRQSC
jgi:hypothetical protein